MNVSRIALAALLCGCTSTDDSPGADAGLDSAALSVLTFAPAADARVEQASASLNYGTSTRLSSDSSPHMRSYLRFQVSGVSGTVVSAKLRLYVRNGSSNGPALYATGTAWSETALTWNNQPGPSGAAIADPAGVSQGAWLELDLSAIVGGDGTYGFVLVPTSSDGLDVDSREGTNRPQLVVTTEATAACGDGTCDGDETCSACPDDCGACPVQVTAAVVADARVEQANASRNYGSATSLVSDLDPNTHSYLRFQVIGVAGQPIAGARLRLWVTNGTGNGPELYAVPSNSWSESGITWSNKPPASGVPLDDKASVAPGAWVEYDLRGLVTGDGTYTVALVPESTDGFAADSREGANRPEVVIMVDAPAVCGDGTCAAGETCSGCADDCGACPSGDNFVFTAAGDHGSSSNTSAVLDLVPASGSDFFLSLGDLSYGTLAPERAWCDYVKSHVGATFPFEIISGAHEDNYEHQDGLIDDFIAPDCLPNRLPGVQGQYGKEFYFDHPSANPTARFIMISPSLDFLYGGYMDYSRGSSHYQWTAAAIDDARARGIRWIVVGMHRNCITMGIKSCEIGADILNLLVEKRVDLILQGHDHNYQRSKQLAHSASCSAIQPNAHNAGCVADSGGDNLYAKGAGPVLVISGMGGISTYSLSTGDAEAPYFASWMTSQTYGLVKATVSPTRMDLQFVRGSGGSYSDSFSIVTP